METYKLCFTRGGPASSDVPKVDDSNCFVLSFGNVGEAFRIKRCKMKMKESIERYDGIFSSTRGSTYGETIPIPQIYPNNGQRSPAILSRVLSEDG